MDRNQGVAGVVRPGKERGEFQGVDQPRQAICLGRQLPFKRLVLAGQFLERLEISAHGERFIERLEHRVDRLQLRDRGLGLL